MTRADGLEPLFDAGHAHLAGLVIAVGRGLHRQGLLTDSQVAAYRKHVVPGTTGTRLWTDPSVGTYVVRED